MAEEEDEFTYEEVWSETEEESEESIFLGFILNSP